MNFKNVATEIAKELDEFMVLCMKRHAKDLQFLEQPERVVIVALIEALAMQVVFHELTNEQTHQALETSIEEVRQIRASGGEPGRIDVPISPKAKA